MGESVGPVIQFPVGQLFIFTLARARRWINYWRPDNRDSLRGPFDLGLEEFVDRLVAWKIHLSVIKGYQQPVTLFLS